MSTVIGIAGAFFVVAFWAICRRISLRHREALATKLEEFFASEEVPEEEQIALYWNYKMARHWFFLPVMALVMPFFMLVAMAARGEKELSRKHSEKHEQAMNLVMKMYITRNPITSMVSLYCIFISFAVMVPIGLILNRLKSIPSATSVLTMISERATHMRVHAR